MPESVGRAPVAPARNRPDAPSRAAASLSPQAPPNASAPAGFSGEAQAPKQNLPGGTERRKARSKGGPIPPTLRP